MIGNFPARRNVYAPFIHGSGQPYTFCTTCVTIVHEGIPNSLFIHFVWLACGENVPNLTSRGPNARGPKRTIPIICFKALAHTFERTSLATCHALIYAQPLVMLWHMHSHLSCFDICTATRHALLYAQPLVMLCYMHSHLSCFDICTATCHALIYAQPLVMLWYMHCHSSCFDICTATSHALLYAQPLIMLWYMHSHLSCFDICTATYHALIYAHQCACLCWYASNSDIRCSSCMQDPGAIQWQPGVLQWQPGSFQWQPVVINDSQA